MHRVSVCVCWLIVGKEDEKKIAESSETYAVGSDRRPVAKKETSTQTTLTDSSTRISNSNFQVNDNMENGQMEIITAQNAMYGVIDLLYGLIKT